VTERHRHLLCSLYISWFKFCLVKYYEQASVLLDFKMCTRDKQDSLFVWGIKTYEISFVNILPRPGLKNPYYRSDISRKFFCSLERSKNNFVSNASTTPCSSSRNIQPAATHIRKLPSRWAKKSALDICEVFSYLAVTVITCFGHHK
jgi:hypothetical protein